uniref:Globin family profile domain-containing protein n=1 Tax=Plectus sambesii TaxID=2011161 RepID=A0A914VGZ2_9BILA
MNGGGIMEDPIQIERLDRLSVEEKRLLIETWEIVGREMEDLSIRIFQMIFEQSPDAKQMFSFIKTDYEHKEKKSKEFIFHALRFMQVIESTIELIDTPSKLEPLLANLGRMHARLEENLGFRTHYWSVFMECTLFHFRRSLKHHNEEFSESDIDGAIILWRVVLRVIIYRMKLGFYANVKRRKANRESLEHQFALMNTDTSSTDVDLSDSHSNNHSPTSSSPRNTHQSPRFFRKKEVVAGRSNSSKK